MKCFKLKNSIVLIISLLLVSAVYGDVADIYKAKKEVKKYHSSGQYIKDIAIVADNAIKYLNGCVAKKRVKLAVVFDIDETLLSNYKYQADKTDFGYMPDLWNKWVAQAAAPPIKPVRELLQIAVKKDVSVFIITGRRENLRSVTEKNLTDAGCAGYKKLYLKAVDYKGTAQEYKSKIRKQIEEDLGYKIIVNIGDQYSDLKGGYSEKTFKLPNHIYFIP